MTKIITLIRPQQWLKNFFVFLPLFFNGQLTNTQLLYSCILAFFAFSFIASSIYCFNDIWDVEADRLHEKKCKRPIASGAISVTTGYIMMVVCCLLSLIVAYLSERFWYRLFIILLFYWVMNIFYCIYLKRIAIIDVFIIALGFVLRVIAGGWVTNIWISHWIVLMSFLLALFLAFAKRRDDVVIFANKGIQTRKNIRRYNLEFINQVISIIGAIIIVCYIMYTVSDDVMKRMHSHYLYITAIWVLAGIIRYLQLTIVDIKSGNPTKVLVKDRFIQGSVLGWILSFFIIIYIH